MTDSPLPDLPALPDLPTIGPVTRRPPPGGPRREWQTATVIGIHRETARLTTFRLRLPAGSPHTPGQHMVIRLTAPDGYTASRSYSIASAPTDGSEIELLVERLEDGEMSSYLHEDLRVGDPLELRGPFGGWFVWNGQQPAILIGGGSGVAPLMAMLRYQRAKPSLAPVRLVLSVRTPQDLPFASEYGPETTVVYTRAAPIGSDRPPGRLDAQTLQDALAPGATAYVCGSSGFADHASDLLVALGQPVGDIRVERYGATS